MAERPLNRHGLETVLTGLPRQGAGIGLRLHSGRAWLNLRGSADTARFDAAVTAVIGTGLPRVPNTFSEGRTRVFWLAPDEWLIESREEASAALLADLGPALSAWHHSLNDVSGGMTHLSLEGAAVRELLSKGCTLDLHPKRLRAGDCAQTGLARAAVLMIGNEDPARIELIVRRSFAEYLVRWLVHSGAEYGLFTLTD